jgi:hypothetical protein
MYSHWGLEFLTAGTKDRATISSSSAERMLTPPRVNCGTISITVLFVDEPQSLSYHPGSRCPREDPDAKIVRYTVGGGGGLGEQMRFGLFPLPC